MAIEGPTYFYVNCAKTASRAITSELCEHYGGVRSCEPWQYTGDKFVFASVRNPYERCLSLWWALTQAGDGYGVVSAVGDDPVAVLDFVFGAEWGAGIRPHPRQGKTSNLCKSCYGFCAGLKVEAVIRYEHLDADFSALPFVQCDTVLPVVNRKSSGRPPRWPLEQPAFIEAVHRYCAEDFIAFDYERRTI